MTNQEILNTALQQSAYDCNCSVEDFLSTENKIVLSRKNEKARVYMPLPLECDLVSYDKEFKNRFFLHGHMNPSGYKLTAEMFVSYIDWIIRNNPKDFEKVGFIKARYNRTII